MIIILSSAKTLDISCKNKDLTKRTAPVFEEQTKYLHSLLKNYNISELAELMSISPKLADYNFSAIQNREDVYNENNSVQSIIAYKGDVFRAAKFSEYKKEDFEFAQKHLRIISGLHGILRPFDTIQPYRLEFAIALKNNKGNDLYKFWCDKIAEQINTDLNSLKQRIVVNLASKEYSKAAITSKLNAKVLDIHFKEERDGELKIISLNAKKARGLMTSFIIKNRLTEIEQFKGFNQDNYFFDNSLSSENSFVFIR